MVFVRKKVSMPYGRKGRVGWVGCSAFLVLIAVVTHADDLPVSAQADLLKHEIAEAIKANRDEDALAALDQYHQLERKGAKMPTLILFIEAQVAKKVGQDWRAYTALTAFLKVAQSSDAHYQDAIVMYSSVAKSSAVRGRLAAQAEEEKRRQQESQEAAVKAQRRAEAAEAERQEREAEASAQAQEAARKAQDQAKKAQVTALARKNYNDAKHQLDDINARIAAQVRRCADQVSSDYQSHKCSFVLGLGDGICSSRREQRETEMQKSCEAAPCAQYETWKRAYARFSAADNPDVDYIVLAGIPDDTPVTCEWPIP